MNQETPRTSDGKSERRPLVWVSAAYFAEGLPWSLLHQVAAEFFTAIGARPSQVGRTALLHVPILLKMLFSPVVERFFTLRSWMLGTQAMMGVVMGGVAILAHRLATSFAPASADASWLWVLLFSIGILSALYDIACDGFYLEHLSVEQQASYSGARVAVYRVAMLLGSFLLVFLGGLVNWLVGFGLGALLLLGLSTLLRVVLPDSTPQRTQVPVEPARIVGAKEAYATFFRQDSWLLVFAFLFFYKAADAMMFSMSSVLLSRQLGIVTEMRATLGMFSTIASIVGAIWGGAWIARRGLSAAMFPITFAMVATEPLYLLMAAAPEYFAVSPAGLGSSVPQLAAVASVLVIEKLCAGLAVAAQTIFIMRRCHPDHKTAHYAFATVIYSVAQILLGLSSGYLFEGLGPTMYYALVSALALPALILVRFVPLEQRGTAAASTAS